MGAIKSAIIGAVNSTVDDAMAHVILAETTASVSELKKNPMGTVAAGEGFPVAILNRNEPAFYCVPARAWEALLGRLEDLEQGVRADACKDQPDGEALTYDELQQRSAVRQGIARGELAVAEDRVLPHRQARARMARWLK